MLAVQVKILWKFRRVCVYSSSSMNVDGVGETLQAVLSHALATSAVNPTWLHTLADLAYCTILLLLALVFMFNCHRIYLFNHIFFIKRTPWRLSE